MSLCDFAVGTAPLAEVIDAGRPSLFVQAWNADWGRVFLYEVTAFKRGVGSVWAPTLGTVTLGDIPDGVNVTGESVLRYSDAGYISGPKDNLANVNFDPSIDDGLRLTRSSPPSPEVDRRVNIDFGTFSIENVDGDLDSTVTGFSVDGRVMRVLLGLNTYRYQDFVPVFTGRMVQWSNDTSKVNVVVRDESYRLDKPMQTALFDGTGGINGGSDLAGRPRPLAFGKCRNIPAPLIDGANLVYQFHSREALAVDAVYDRGAALTVGADYATYAALTAAAVSVGNVVTCLALGLFRLGGTPSGLVTADVRGDAHGGYVDTTAQISLRMLQDYGAVASSQVDANSWSNFAVGLPGTIGWFQGTDPINISDALDAIFAHCAGWWGADPNGLFQCGRLAAFDGVSYLLDLDEPDILDFRYMDPLPNTYPPRWRQQVGYQRLWTVQADQDLAGTVTAARRQYLAQQSRLVSSSDTAVQAAFLLAPSPDPLQSLFDSSADAQSLCDGLLAFHKVLRQTFQLTLELRGLGPRLTSGVRVRHRRLNGGQVTVAPVLDVTILAAKRQVQLVCMG